MGSTIAWQSHRLLPTSSGHAPGSADCLGGSCAYRCEGCGSGCQRRSSAGLTGAAAAPACLLPRKTWDEGAQQGDLGAELGVYLCQVC